MLAILLFLGLLSNAVAQYSPVCDLENGYDYPGNDIKNVPGKATDCCGACYNTSSCRAWTWSNHQGGTCWLKSGATTIEVNANTISSRNPGRYTLAGCTSAYYQDVDFYGNDIGTAKAPKFRDCCDICRNKFGCRAYSWSDHEGGTCWLKSKRSSQMTYKAGVVAAEAYMSEFVLGPIASFYAIEAGVDYEGNDIKHISNVPASQCGSLCDVQSDPRCFAYSWSDYEGGTCWLKSARGATKPNSAVTSGVVVRASSYPWMT